MDTKGWDDWKMGMEPQLMVTKYSATEGISDNN